MKGNRNRFHVSTHLRVNVFTLCTECFKWIHILLWASIYIEHSVCIFPFQGPECTEEAVIDDWRVTICKTEDRNDSQNKVRLLCLFTFVVNI